jgi:hypothetical protein
MASTPETEHGSAPPASDENEAATLLREAPEPRPIDWGLVVEVVGLGAALAAWVAVVGGGRVWARLEAANVPALPTLAGLGQEWFIVEGLQTLFLPLLLGGIVALIAYYSAPLERRAGGDGAEPVGEGNGEAESDEATAEAPKSVASTPQLMPSARSPHTWSRRVSWTKGPSHRATGDDALVVPHTWARRVRARSGASRTERMRKRVRQSAPVNTTVVFWNRLTRLRQITAVADEFREVSGYVGALALAVAVSLLVVTILIAEVSPWVLGAFLMLALIAAVIGLRSDWPVERLTLVPLSILLVGILVALVLAVKVLWLVVMFVVPALAVWITLGALVGKRAGRFALTMFVAIAAWSGALGLAQERGARQPELAHAVVHLNEADPVGGYYLGRSSDRLYVAQDLPLGTVVQEGANVDRQVVALESDDVDRVVFTDERPLPEEGGEQPPKNGEDSLGGGKDQEGGQEEEGDDTEPPTSSPVPPVELQPEQPVESRNGEIGTQVIQFQVLALKRRAGFVELDARVMNLSTEPLRVGSAFGKDGDPSLDGIELFNARNSRTYETARRDDGTCVCDENLDEVELERGESVRLSTMFELAPPAGTLVDLRVPNVGWIRDVEIT